MAHSDAVRLDICNTALTNLNARRIAAFTGSAPGSNEQELCGLHFDKAYQTALSEANWSFALTRVKLRLVTPDKMSGVGLGGWGYMYYWNAGYIKLISVYPEIKSEQEHYQNINKRRYGQQEFAVENRLIKLALHGQPEDTPVILCDIKDAVGLVISSDADILEASYTFRECVIYKLSSLLALPILGSRSSMGLINQFEQRYDQLLKKAWVQDSANHYTPNRRESKLISCRF